MCVKQTLIMPGATDGWPVCMLIICPGLRYKILHFLANSLGFMKILLYFWLEAKQSSRLGVWFLTLDLALGSCVTFTSLLSFPLLLHLKVMSLPESISCYFLIRSRHSNKKLPVLPDANWLCGNKIVKNTQILYLLLH